MASFMLLSTDEYLESTKSEEEIKQLIMIDQGSTEKNMIYILTKGHPLQKPYVYRSFIPYWKQLLSYVIISCQQDTPENQTLVTQSLIELIKTQKNNLHQENITRIFNLCLNCINRQNWYVNKLWGVTLEKLLELNSSTEKIQKIECLIFELSKLTQPIISRVSAGRLISIVSKYMKKLKPYMIDTLRSIISYSDEEPKVIWIEEFFPKLLKNCEFTFLEVHLQEKLMELIYDKNQNIGIKSLELIMRNCQLFRKEEQHSRIAKLFVDAMMSRQEKTILMISSIMGEVYQKLEDSIRMKEDINVSFWESLMELSQSKNSNIINNFLFNLPGILTLSKSYYNIEPISQVYIGLFYENLTNKSQLICCFHEMIKIFPSKKQEFKEIIYDIFEEVFDEDKEDYEEIFSVIDIFLHNFSKINSIFLTTFREEKELKLEENIVKYLIGYWNKIQKRKNSNQIQNFQRSLLTYIPLISYDHLILRFIPKLFTSLKLNLPINNLIIESLVLCFHQIIGNLNYISGYISKIFIEFGKSIRSFEREIALKIFIKLCKVFSVEMVKELKIVDKILYFHSDKSFKIKYYFVTLIHEIKYLFSKQEYHQYQKIIHKYQNSNQQQIKQYISKNKKQFEYNPSEFEILKLKNNEIRQEQKLRELLIPQKKASIKRDSSVFKEARVSLKDQTLKMYNKKKVIMNEFSTINGGDLKKKKFKITTKLVKKA